MNRREAPRPLDAALAIALWAAGFVVLRAFGTFLPLTVGAVSLAALFLARDPELRETLAPNLWVVTIGVGVGAAMIAATYAGYWATAQVWPGLADRTRELYGLLRPDRYAAPLVVLLLAATAAAEEVIFRGRLMPRGGPLWRRCLIPGLIYAAAHLTGGSGLLVVLALGCGLLWGAVRVLTGSLLAAILVHVAWDLAIMVVHPLIQASL